MHLNGAVTSPYANSNNQSQSSIAASLQRERGIPQPSGVRNSGLSATSSHMSQQPMSPLAPYPGESRQAFTTRTAPIISANPMKEVYNAEKPTVGQPYAFPDPDMSGGSSAGSLHERNGSTMLSRRNSDHTSITSSIVTNDSKLPKGQHRLDEDPMPGTHHHSLQSKHVSSIAGESDSPDAASPYSRTPALRASHKMAERKRRTEMKFLFEQLRNQIPANHGSKSSKWEILSKGVWITVPYITAPSPYLPHCWLYTSNTKFKPLPDSVRTYQSPREVFAAEQRRSAAARKRQCSNGCCTSRDRVSARKCNTIASKPDHRRPQRCIPKRAMHHLRHREVRR